MTDIVLATLNARYAHASLALRYLLANLGEDLRPRASLREFTIKQDLDGICRELLAASPKVLGLGVYIWNVAQSTELVRRLKAARPELRIVLGGPEVSHEVERQEIVQLADHVITGEGEVAFPRLCRTLLADESPGAKVIAGELPKVDALALPYSLYDETDVRERVVYVEASRGCPFRCEFCLSSLDKAVRDIPLAKLLPELDALLSRGVTQFKFIDRTFNLKVEVGREILEFFLARYRPGMFLHFEMIPDRLPEPLREVIARFPMGALQFEVGVQTLNEAVSRRISRQQHVGRLEENFRFLRENTGVHVHADLIVGLPGESLTSFGDGFNKLHELRPQEIQVGMLKRLRGTPIIRHDGEWGMVYDPLPPYEIQETNSLPRAEVERMRRFAKYWDLVHNSGNFRESVALILGDPRDPFGAFLRFSDWLYARLQRKHSIALDSLAHCVFDFLVDQGEPAERVGPLVLADYMRPGGRRVPVFLAPYHQPRAKPARTKLAGPARQGRHLLSD